jgi:predicted DCC family thiol-disulfide oxidoreductase YuxK
MSSVPLIVLIDGECPLCDATATWFARHDPAGRLIFARNQGVVARIADEPPGGDLRTLVVWDGSRRLVRSAAVLSMLRALGGGWGLCARFLTWVPATWRDRVYDLVAARRRRRAGLVACKLLSPLHLAD